MDLINEISNKYGEISSKRAVIIADIKFKSKDKLKIKFYESVLDGNININDEWSNDSIISEIKSNILSLPKDKINGYIKMIMSAYDTKKDQNLIKTYKRYLK